MPTQDGTDPIKPIKQMFRPKQGRKLGGVSLAFANYFGVDVTIVRLVWVILSLPGGLPGIIPYITCWILIPEE